MYGGDVECAPVHVFFLIAAVNFIPLWWPLPFLILSKIFMLFFQRNWFPLFLISRALALSLLSTSMETLKLCRKKEVAL